MVGTAMPKTTVNEKRQLLDGKHKIRPAGNGLMPPPAGDASGAEYGHNLQFGLSITPRADFAHHLRAFCF